jgi:hypothetical protein
MNSSDQLRRQQHRPLADIRPAPAALNGSTPPWLALVADEVKSLRFGIIQITVHDARVVQIERTERTRIEVGA